MSGRVERALRLMHSIPEKERCPKCCGMGASWFDGIMNAISTCWVCLGSGRRRKE
jgi:hypothetical protein